MKERAAALAIGKNDRTLVLERSDHGILYDHDVHHVIESVLSFLSDEWEAP